MARALALGVAGGLALLAATPALADVRTGVEAWLRGDYRTAVEQWRPAAIAGDADAQFDLGQAYKLGKGVPTDLAQAEIWYRRAAQQGHPQAEDNLGLLLFQQGKRPEAVPYLERSVARGEPRAQLILGTMLYNGDAVARDFPRAYALIVRSSAQGLPQAAQVQAQMDQYVPPADRQRGLVLARQYEASAQRPQLPPEITGAGTRDGMRGTELPPSSYADGPAGPPPGAPLPPRGGRPPIVASNPPPPAYPPPPSDHRPSSLPYPSSSSGYPPSPPADQPPPHPVVTGRGWRVQLGAFRDEGNARRLFDGLSHRVPALAGAQPFLVRTGTLTRLQVGPYASSGEALRVCAAVRPTGTPCVPVAP